MIELRKVGPPLTEEILAHFEKELGVSLPDPYRRFLLRNNGGRPPRDKDTVDVEGLPGSPTSVQVFFRIGGEIESSDLMWNRETLNEHIPTDRLAIACDSGGGVFCILLHGAERGAVFFCDLHPVYGSPEVYPGFYPVAPDFDSFLKKIREFPDEPPEGGELVYADAEFLEKHKDD